jgi:uncharacterized protein YceK
MKNLSLLMIATAITTLSGCASIISGSTDNIVVSSTPIGADFTVTNRQGSAVHHGITPQTVVVERGASYFEGQSYILDFKKDGYIPKSFTLNHDDNPWVIGNLLFGGLIGLLIVDPSTGAMYDFPENLSVNLDPMPTKN